MLTLKKTKKYTISFDLCTATGQLPNGGIWSQHSLQHETIVREFLSPEEAAQWATQKLLPTINGYSAFTVYNESGRMAARGSVKIFCGGL